MAIVAVLISIGNTGAFGVASQYLENKTLVLEQGSNERFELTIQNPDDREVRYAVIVDSPYVSVDGDSFIAPPKTYDNKVYLNITSNDLQEGEGYEVQYTVAIKGSEGGTVPLQYQITRKFNVLVGEQRPEPVGEGKDGQYIYFAGLLAIILVLVYFLLKTSKVIRR